MDERWWDVVVDMDGDMSRTYAVLAEDREEAKRIAIEQATGIMGATAVPMEGFDPEQDGDFYDAVLGGDE